MSTSATAAFQAPEIAPEVVERYTAQGRTPVALDPFMVDGRVVVECLGGYTTEGRAGFKVFRDLGDGMHFWVWERTAGEVVAEVVDDGLQSFGGHTDSQATSPRRYAGWRECVEDGYAFGRLMEGASVRAPSIDAQIAIWQRNIEGERRRLRTSFFAEVREEAEATIARLERAIAERRAWLAEQAAHEQQSIRDRAARAAFWGSNEGLMRLIEESPEWDGVLATAIRIAEGLDAETWAGLAACGWVEDDDASRAWLAGHEFPARAADGAVVVHRDGLHLQSYTLRGEPVSICPACAGSTLGLTKWSGEIVNGFCDGCGAGPSVSHYRLVERKSTPEPALAEQAAPALNALGEPMPKSPEEATARQLVREMNELVAFGAQALGGERYVGEADDLYAAYDRKKAQVEALGFVVTTDDAGVLTIAPAPASGELVAIEALCECDPEPPAELRHIIDAFATAWDERALALARVARALAPEPLITRLPAGCRVEITFGPDTGQSGTVEAGPNSGGYYSVRIDGRRLDPWGGLWLFLRSELRLTTAAPAEERPWANDAAYAAEGARLG